MKTEEQMIQRLNEINEEKNKLNKEKQEIESHLFNKKREEVLNMHKTFINKCFKSKELKDNEERHIRAFKILEVLDSPNENYALCLALVDGYRYTCWKEYGIQLQTLGLWTPNKNRMISCPSDPKTIDFYEEITQEEFDKLYKEYLKTLETTRG